MHSGLFYTPLNPKPLRLPVPFKKAVELLSLAAREPEFGPGQFMK